MWFLSNIRLFLSTADPGTDTTAARSRFLIQLPALPDTRLYVDLMVVQGNAVLAIKNISREQLNVNADELMERFVRGDTSRNTEGSGLGLSIAKNLTEIQGGNFSVYLDGDLFRVTITFPKLEALPEDMSIGLLEENIEASLTESLAEKTEETSEEM